MKRRAQYELAFGAICVALDVVKIDDVALMRPNEDV